MEVKIFKLKLFHKFEQIIIVILVKLVYKNLVLSTELIM